MKTFKLPRKTKKFLKKGFWFYPVDERDCSLMASPHRSEKDFLAYKKGILRNLLNDNRKEQKEERKKLDQAIIVPDETLRSYVNDIIDKDFAYSSYDLLIRAKNKKSAKLAYYNFINAYQIYEKGDESMGNICCMAIDLARDLLRKKHK